VRACALAPAALAIACYTTLDPTHLDTQCSDVTLASVKYSVCSTPLDHANAAADCARRGAHLAAIGSEEEDTNVALTATSIVNGNLWLGGSRSDDFVWSWPDGTVFWRGERDGSAEGSAFVRWQSGEPNNTSSIGAPAEACLALTAENADWNDRSCDLELPYVCEFD
jgi:hypothetical protein